MIQILKPDFEFSDERGKLTQLVNEGFKQVNVIESNAGVKRGGHYHKINREAFFVVDGDIELTAKRNNQEAKYKFVKGDMFLIDKYVYHDFHFITKTILVSMYDHGVELDLNKKDIYST